MKVEFNKNRNQGKPKLKLNSQDFKQKPKR